LKNKKKRVSQMSKQISLGAYNRLMGDKLNRMRRKCGLTFKQLGRITKVHPYQLSMICEGKMPISPRLAVELETIYFGQAQDWVKSELLPQIESIKAKDKRFTK